MFFFFFVQTAVQDTFNKAEGAATVFHHEPLEDDDQNILNDDGDDNDNVAGPSVIASTSTSNDVAIVAHNQVHIHVKLL